MSKTDLKQVFDYFPSLQQRTKQIAGTLSGGEQQMLAIGRAQMSRPKILLLDEPSLGLAPKIVLELLHIIKEINTQGVTIVLVEQNVYQALQIAHYGCVLETGKIAFSGSNTYLQNLKEIRNSYLGK